MCVLCGLHVCRCNNRRRKYYCVLHSESRNRNEPCIVHATLHPYMGRMKTSFTQRIRYKLSQTRYHLFPKPLPQFVVYAALKWGRGIKCVLNTRWSVWRNDNNP